MRGKRGEARGIGFYFLCITLWLTAVFLFWLILRTVSLTETWMVLRRLRWWQLALLAVANGLALLLMNGRWWLILHRQGHPIPYLTLTCYRLAGASLSYITPGPQFGGEPLQVLLIERNDGVPRPTAVATVTLDKTLELVVNFSFLLGGVMLAWQTEILGEVAGWETAVLPLGLLLLPLSLLINFLLDWHLFTRLAQFLTHLLRFTKWFKTAQKLQQGIAASEQQLTLFCHQQPYTLSLALLISLLAWAALTAEFWLMLALLGIEVTFIQMIVILTAARVAILLPLPGGLGTLEASQLLALTAFGFEPAAALSLSLLIHMRDIILFCLGLWLTKISFQVAPLS